MEFIARVGEPTGAVVEKTFTSDSEASLRMELERRGLYVVKLRPKARGMGGPRGGARAVDATDFLSFNMELVALVHAGLPLLQCLGLLAERRKNEYFRNILLDVQSKVKSGTSLSDAFASHGSAFPAVYAPSVLAGERSGNIEEVLRRYVTYSQIIAGVKRKVFAALIYPAILISLSMVLVMVLLTYVIPKFSEFFRDFDAKLPWITSVLMAIAAFMQANVLYLLAGVVGVVIAYRVASMSPGAHALRDRLLLDLPAVGTVLRKYHLSQFARTLGTLLSGGLPLMTALQVASSAIANAHVLHRMQKVSERVREGGGLTDALEATGLWSDTTIQMIRVGESSGALAEMLTNVSDFFDGEVDRQVHTFVTLLEPALLVVMGGVVSAMLLAMYYPIFTIIQVVQ